MRRCSLPFLALALVSALVVAPRAVAAQQSELLAPLPVDSAVRTGTLDNGMHYYVRENHRPQERAELRLVVDAGSVLENDAQRGLAHFVEHMAFNGTANFEKQAIVDYLESIGMRFGADLNAYTSFDETVYMLTVPTDSAAYLEQGFRILGDWAHAVSFDTTEVRKERGVVIEEWRLGQGAGERIRAQIFPVLFGGSRYAERLPIGTRESIASFDYDDLVAFYETWYRPELMAVVAVGDFDADRVEALIREHIGAVPAAPLAQPRETYTVPPTDSTRIVIARDVEATNTVVEVYWLQPARVEGTVGAYRASLIEALYNSMLNARFAELAQAADPPFVGAASQGGSFIRAHEAYTLAALVADTGVVQGLDALLTEATRVARHGFTATELERARANLLRGYEQAFAERDKTNSASYANEYTSLFLEGVPSPGIAYEYELVQRLLPDITLDETNRVAGTWLGERGRTIVVQMPQQDDLTPPTADELRAVAARVDARDIAPYTDDVAGDVLLPTLPTPGRVVSTDSIVNIDVVEWTLSNGVR
ncbi:MAG: M16 family metallopeptidase, partial [Longimicrobiales bacterium]